MVMKIKMHGNLVDATSLRYYIVERIPSTDLVHYIPSDGPQYGIKNGSPQEWANYFTGLAYHESGLDVNSTGDHGNSKGLFQLSEADAVNYHLKRGQLFTLEELIDPTSNTNAAIAIHEALVVRANSIEKGAGKYWGPISQEGWTPGHGRDKVLPWARWTAIDKVLVDPHELLAFLMEKA